MNNFWLKTKLLFCRIVPLRLAVKFVKKTRKLGFKIAIKYARVYLANRKTYASAISAPLSSSKSPHYEDSILASRRFYHNEVCKYVLEALDKTVQIIVPIYNAYDDVRLCIESVLCHTHINFKLVLIDDCSTDSRIRQLLDSYKERNDVSVLYNTSNLGFVKTANRGFTETTGDVILLNSDTIVTERWALKLLTSAYTDERIATVTPFSNAAGAFSIPENLTNNEIPANLSIDKMAKLVESVSKFEYPEVPTGNGFCIFIKRDVLQEIGGFDDETFHRGYGEENDFCMRAKQKEWKHIINDAVYIYHKRSASFNDEKEKLIKENTEKLKKRHPTYSIESKKFVNSEQMRDIRKRISNAMNAYATTVVQSKNNILYVVHDGYGGTGETNKDLMSFIQSGYECYLLTCDGIAAQLWFYRNGKLEQIKKFHIERWDIRKFNVDKMQELYFNILHNFNISIVHIRHLVSHSLDLPRVASLMGIPIVLSLHDFYFICPSIHLVNGDDVYCDGICDACQSACVRSYGWVSTDVPDLRNFVQQWRNAVQKYVLPYCNVFVTTHKYVKDLFCRVYPNLSESDFRVIEHGRNFEDVDKSKEYTQTHKNGQPIKILLLGGINFIKGGGFISEIKRLDKGNLIEFHFLGNQSGKWSDGVQYGPYKRDDLPKFVEKIKPSFAGIFSIWPETYCHTLTEVWACGIPVFVSDIGVIKERTVEHDAGWVIDHTNPTEAYQKILEIAGNAVEYQRVKRNVESVQIRSVREMGADYSGVYHNLLQYIEKG